MKRYIYGIITGVSFTLLVLVVALVAIPVMAANQETLVDWEADPNTLVWLEEEPEAIYNGMDIAEVQSGALIVDILNEGTPNQINIIKQGVVIKFNKMPSATKLQKLDIDLNVTKGYVRDGGKTVSDSILDNGTAIETMSASLPEPEPEPEVNPIRDLISRWRNR